MKVGIYPGSFDPVTLGHMDIIERSRSMFDVLIVGVLQNIAKQSLFTIDERVDMLKELTKNMEQVKIMSFTGLLVDFARKNNAQFIVRGLRSVTDFEYELQMAQGNRHLAPELDTLFLAAETKHAFVSSSAVKEIATYGGEVAGLVPDAILDKIYEKLGRGVNP